MPSENDRDELFASLSHPRRRALLDSLAAREPPVSACELARAVAGEVADDPDDVSTETVQRVYLSLYHAHLPKLAAADVIDFDRDSNRVSTGPQFRTAIEVLERAVE